MVRKTPQVLLLSVLFGIFAMFVAPFAGATPNDEGEVSPQSIDNIPNSAEGENAQSAGPSEENPIANEEPDSSDIVPFTEERFSEIEAAGGYSVSVSALADVLLEAETGATPIPTKDRVWRDDEQDPRLRNLSVELMPIVDKYPENLVGGAFSNDDSFLELFAKDPEGPGIAEIASLVGERGMAGKVVIVPVSYSMSELQQAIDVITAEYGETVSVEVDMVADGLLVNASDPEVGSSLLGDERAIEVTVDQITDVPNTLLRSSVGTDISSIPVYIEAQEEASVAGRYNDYSPFVMGGEISGPGGCSLGVPIVHRGVFRVLTAGHCGSGEFLSGAGAKVGTTWANTVKAGTAGKFGDWQILTGKNYLLQIWNTPAKSHAYSVLPIGRAHWDSLWVGTQLCTSGKTTGQICSFRVRASQTSQSFTGIGNVGSLTFMQREWNLGVADTGGFRGGDSGGPVYYNDGAGRMVVVGIVTGWDKYGSEKKYWFTRLDGVKAAYPEVYLG